MATSDDYEDLEDDDDYDPPYDGEWLDADTGDYTGEWFEPDDLLEPARWSELDVERRRELLREAGWTALQKASHKAFIADVIARGEIPF